MVGLIIKFHSYPLKFPENYSLRIEDYSRTVGSKVFLYTLYFKDRQVGSFESEKEAFLYSMKLPYDNI